MRTQIIELNISEQVQTKIDDKVSKSDVRVQNVKTAVVPEIFFYELNFSSDSVNMGRRESQQV